MTRTIRRIAVLAALAAAVPAGAAQAACEDAGLAASPQTRERVAAAITCVTNEARAARGLGKLTPNRKLAAAASRHSDDMVRRGYFEHVSPEGGTLVDRLRKVHYVASGRKWAVRENLAWAAGQSVTAEMIVRLWIESPAHRENLFARNIREAGIGITFGSPEGDADGVTVTANYGKRGR